MKTTKGYLAFGVTACVFLWVLYDILAPGLHGGRPLVASLGWVGGIVSAMALYALTGRIKNPWVAEALSSLGMTSMIVLLGAAEDWNGGKTVHAGALAKEILFIWPIVAGFSWWMLRRRLTSPKRES